jgi:hypothetical protein
MDPAAALLISAAALALLWTRRRGDGDRRQPVVKHFENHGHE